MKAAKTSGMNYEESEFEKIENSQDILKEGRA